MKKIVIRIISILVIITISLGIFKLSQTAKKGTVETFLNLNEKDIKYIICDGKHANVDEFVGIYWYKVFEETNFDKNSHIKSDCKGYNSNDKLLFELVTLDNDTYLFDKKEININDQIDNAYFITK